MQHHYPSVVGRFALVDVGLLILVTAALVVLARRARMSKDPWMVIFTAQDGSICPGLDRYDTRQAATLAAGRISNVVVSGERRPVQRYIVALDPARDPGPQETQAQADDRREQDACLLPTVPPTDLRR